MDLLNKNVSKYFKLFWGEPEDSKTHSSKGNKNLRIPVLVNHEFSQSMDFLEKPRPYTFQMGSRLSLEIKNFISSVLDHCENFLGKCVRFPNISVPIYIYSDVLLRWNLEEISWFDTLIFSHSKTKIFTEKTKTLLMMVLVTFSVVKEKSRLMFIIFVSFM